MSSIDQISTSEIPTLDILKIFFDKTTADETAAIPGLSSDKLSNFIKAKITVSLSYSDIYADTTVNKYLKFKVIFCSSDAELNYYKNNITKLNNSSDKNVKTFSFADLRYIPIPGKQSTYIFDVDYILRTDSSKTIVSDEKYNILLYSHYDIEKLEQDYNFSIKDTIDFEGYFYSEPSIVNIKTLFNNRKTLSKDLYSLYTHTLTDDLLFSRASSKIKPVKKYGSYISPLLVTKDNRSGKDILRYGFFFDKDRFVLENTFFPELYNTDLWQNVLDGSKEINIEFIRHKTADIEKTGNLFNELLKAPVLSDAAKNVFNNLNFYTGIDETVYTKRSGFYTYNVKLNFTDGAFSVVLTQINNLKNNIKKLKEYKTIVSQPTISTGYIKDLNPYIDTDDEIELSKFKIGKYSYEEDRVLETAAPDYNILLANFSKPFISAYSCLYEIQNTTIIEALLLSMIMPSIASLSTIETVIHFHYRLLNEFKNILKRKLNYIDETILLNEQNNGFGQVPLSLQTIIASRIFDTQVDSDESPSFGLRYHIATGIDDNGIVSLSEADELISYNIYGNKQYIGPKYLYLNSLSILPLALTGIPENYFDSIYSFLETYNTKTFDKLLDKYNYIDGPFQVTSTQAAQKPFSSRILLNKNKISFDGIVGINNLDQSNNSLILDNGLRNLSNLIEEWSELDTVNGQKIPKIQHEYDLLDKRTTTLASLFAVSGGPRYPSCFKVVYDGIREVWTLDFYSKDVSSDDLKKFIAPASITLMNSFKMSKYDVSTVASKNLFISNSDIQYIKENNKSINVSNKKDTKLCYLYEYTDANAGLTSSRFNNIPIFNRWFFLNNSESPDIKMESFGSTLINLEPVVAPVAPTIPVTQTVIPNTNTNIPPIQSPSITATTQLPSPVINLNTVIQGAPQVVSVATQGLLSVMPTNTTSQITPVQTSSLIPTPAIGNFTTSTNTLKLI